MLDTNSIAATTQQAIQMAPVLTKWQAHWPAVMGAGMAAVHFAHLAWPKILAAWPYLEANGGIKGIWKTLWNGKPKVQTQYSLPPIVVPESQPLNPTAQIKP